MMPTPKAAYRDFRFYIPFLGHKSYEQFDALKTVKLPQLIDALKPVMTIDPTQVNQIYDNLPKSKSYGLFSLFSLGYDSTSNGECGKLSDNDITVLFDTYHDELAADILVRSNKIFYSKFLKQPGYQKPLWLDTAYKIAKEQDIFFQDSQGIRQCLCHFHAGEGIINVDLEFMIKSIESIKSADKELDKYIRSKKQFIS